MDQKRQEIEALYRRFGPFVKGRAYRMLGQMADAEEVCQEVFATLLRVEERLEFSERVHRYIYRCATHEIYRRLGQKRRHAAFVEGWVRQKAEEGEESEATDDLDRSLLLLDWTKLEPRLQKELSSEESELLYYVFFEDLPTSEIAVLFEIGDRAARKRIEKLKQRLLAFASVR